MSARGGAGSKASLMAFCGELQEAMAALVRAGSGAPVSQARHRSSSAAHGGASMPGPARHSTMEARSAASRRWPYAACKAQAADGETVLHQWHTAGSAASLSSTDLAANAPTTKLTAPAP